jgi:hypothetical protein
VSYSQPGGPDLCIYAPCVSLDQLYPQAPGLFFVAFYDAQDYGGGGRGILTRLHTRQYRRIQSHLMDTGHVKEVAM